jgi:GGDEF domain-containing protein
MFSYQHNIPKQHYRVDTYPGLPELAKFIEQAQKIKGIKHCFYWVDDKAVQFTLSLHLKKANEEMQWWMHESSEMGQRMLWYYRTMDLGVIYPQILQAVGARNPLEEEPEELSGTIMDSLGTIKSATPANRYVSPGSTLASQQPQSNKPPIAKLLSGTLESIPMSSFLQTAHKEDASGKLTVEAPDGEGVVVFLHGRPVHAATPSQTGIEAMLELCTWMQGKVSFSQGTKADTTTLHQPVEQILYLAAELIENIGFLQDHHIDDMSVLTRATSNISEQAFEKRILDGPPLGLDLQKRFFQNLDGNRTLKDISLLLSLNPSQWIAIATNLLKLGLALTPDGKTVMHDPYEDAKAAQQITGSFYTENSGGNDKLGMPDQQAINRAQQSGTGQYAQSQGTSGQFQQNPAAGGFPAQPPTQATSGTFPTNPQGVSGNFSVNPQSTSGTFPTKPPAQTQPGNWGNQPQQQQAAAPLLPPNAMFGAGGGGAGANQSLPSPAVQAFMSNATTTLDVDTVHVGLQTTDVFLNKNTPKQVMAGLTDSATGILTFEALQFFLDREFARSFRFGTTFSLMVFCMKLRSNEKPTMQASKIVSLTTGAISKIKHDVDVFGHFGEKGYAIILPNANSGQAATLVDKITTNLSKFAPELAQTRPSFFFGIANVPTDAKDVDSLVANAQRAMQEAIKKNVTRVMFSDIGR